MHMGYALADLFGVKYPIVQGGMRWVANPALVSAVANAGALGFLSTIECSSGRDLERLVNATRSETEEVFGVNLTLLPFQSDRSIDTLVDAVADLQVPVVETAGGDPARVMQQLKSRGIKVIHKCASFAHAVKAERVGADAVILNGLESAGHIGQEAVPNLVLIPYASDRLKIPVIASGGFADGRGLVAALVLGASGINVGTQFLLTKESPASSSAKEYVIARGLDASAILSDASGHLRRVANNRHAKLAAAASEAGEGVGDVPAVSRFFEEEASKRAILGEGVDDGIWALGVSAALTGEIRTCEEFVKSLMEHADRVLPGHYGSVAS